MGQGGAALAVAHSKLNLVQTRLECLILRGVGLKVELDAVPGRIVTIVLCKMVKKHVLAGGKASVNRAVTEGLGLGGDDADLELASSGLVEDSEEDIDLKGGSLGSRGGSGAHFVELGLAAIVDGAGVENLRK